VIAQQPSYSKLGEDQFRGIQIYDVIQDKQSNYWFATNDGIYKYNYYSFEKITCPKAKSNSVFNFVINEAGIIFCHNLNNQVFKIIGESCMLIYELKADEESPDISLSIGDDNCLLVGAKKIIVLKADGSVKNRFDVKKHYLGVGFKRTDNLLQFHLSGCDSVVTYSNGVFELQKLYSNTPTEMTSYAFKFFTNAGNTYAFDLKKKTFFTYNPFQFTLSQLPENALFDRSRSVRIYETGNELWVAGTLPGIQLVENRITTTIPPLFYDDFFISDVYKDVEGNTLLSTFDKGVLVIPDLNVPDVIDTFRDDPVTTLYSDQSVGLILGSSEGKLMTYQKGDLITINALGKRPIEVVQGDPSSELIIYDDGYIRAYNKRTGEITDLLDASLKDAVFISPTTFYLGTNVGIYRMSWNDKKTFSTEAVDEIGERVYFIEYNKQNKCLYASTANGLFEIPLVGRIRKITYNGEVVFPNYLHYSNGIIAVSTKKDGVLIIERNHVTRVIHPLINGKEEELKKIIFYNNTILAKSSNGFFQFDQKGSLMKSIHSIFGFPSKRVIDFTVHNEQLWVSHSGGVQQIDLKYTTSNTQTLTVRIDKMLLNNVSYDFKKAGHFSSNQRKIQFVFSSPTLRNRQTIRYYFRLVGNDNTWSINDGKSNQVTYNALASGHYTFQVKTENQGVFSKTISFSFDIASPIYLRWWFIMIGILLFLGFVFLIYRWQLKIQQKKSQQINELNASKLTAIQSQMNPHFIFNSLNSIQDLILKGDVEHSYSYITTFSNLVRRTLNYSDKDFIDFDQELKLLELYLSLEKLRFKTDFNYTILHENVDDIMLPPLLVQPFIENALVHGLLHKEGQKRLKITFELTDVLICCVEDNGVGREKAKAINLRQRSEHESFSGKAIHKRFEILSNVFEGQFGYEYEDLMENGEPSGTKVTLKIPIKHRF